MELGSTRDQMDISMKANGKTINHMAKVKLNIRITHSMKGNCRRGSATE